MVKARPARKVAASAPRNHAGTRREACAGPRDPAPGPQYRTTQPSTVRRHGARGEGWRGCSGSVWVSKVRALELRLGVRDPNQLYLASPGPGARLGGLGAPCGGQLLHGATSCFVEQLLQTDTSGSLSRSGPRPEGAGLPGAPNGRPLGYGGRPHHSGELSRSAFDWCGDRTQTVDGSGRNDG